MPDASSAVASPVARLHVPFLDGLRGLAVLAVYLYHNAPTLDLRGDAGGWTAGLAQALRAILEYGYLGVAVFFVISGYCIHLSHRRSDGAGWGGFTIRRFFRIYPPYLLAMLIFFWVPPFGLGHIPNLMHAGQLVTHTLLIHNLDGRFLFGINPSFWSVAVEVQLYAIYPLLILLVNRWGWSKSLLAVGLIELILRLTHLAWPGEAPPLLDFSPFAFWFTWSIGAWLAEAHLADRPCGLERWPAWAVLLAVVLTVLVEPLRHFAFPAVAVATAVVIARAVAGRLVVPDFPGRSGLWAHLSFLGVVSYSVYLLHQPISAVFRGYVLSLWPTIHPLAFFGLALVFYLPVLALSWAAFRWVEQPAIALGRNCLRSYRNRQKA